MFSREFEHDTLLQWALGALVFCYFTTFHGWVRASVITLDAFRELWYLCPPYFQSCGDFYFLRALPEGYSQTFLYMLFFAVLVWCVYLFSERKWGTIQWYLIPLFVWHVLNVFVLSDIQRGNYEYYVIAFGAVLLFLPHKRFFLSLSLILFYVLSTATKIHPGWILGTYFSSLQDGLPIFSEASIPLWTNVVIVMEMIGAWFLLSKRVWLQRSVLTFFVLFHLYSGILVEYHYPSIVLPMLLIAFGPWYRPMPVPLDRKSIWGWTFVAALFVFQGVPHAIVGDEKLTLEGNKFGLYMFEANHQCISHTTTFFGDGTLIKDIDTNNSARNRCDPYAYWFRLREACARDERVERIAWTFDHSINGGNFLRIVDVPDLCTLEYRPFTHNEWIKTEFDRPESVGMPVRNLYY